MEKTKRCTNYFGEQKTVNWNQEKGSDVYVFWTSQFSLEALSNKLSVCWYCNNTAEQSILLKDMAGMGRGEVSCVSLIFPLSPDLTVYIISTSTWIKKIMFIVSAAQICWVEQHRKGVFSCLNCSYGGILHFFTMQKFKFILFMHSATE